jgi:uncharacterized protein YndB with AHSA1/START domain
VITIGTARAVADLAEGLVLATVEVAVPPERAFGALASEDVARWWVRPGVFDTRGWSGEVRLGGRWKTTGMAGGRPYTIEGVFTEVDPPTRLAHTWSLDGGPESTLTYQVEPAGGGARITLRHTGLAPRQTCAATCIGWETSFEALVRLFG